MRRGKIFDIKHYAIHDGPGIRTTVFFKGCPLRCWWCHNPEGISPEPELMVKPDRCLEECDLCLASCPEQALSKPQDSIEVDTSRCRSHGLCAAACPTGALEMAGREMSTEEVMAELLKDRIFYERSGGGVTFSGGEPLQQPEFLGSLLTACRRHRLHTVLDTSGQAAYDRIAAVREDVDLFFYDLKHLDPEKHREMTGTSNERILDNLKRLSRTDNRIEIRIPLVTGVNDDLDHAHRVADLIAALPGIRDVSLLPYHHMASRKYQNLNKPYLKPDAQPPSDSAVSAFRSVLEAQGFRVKIGG